MDDFILFFREGIHHITDLKGYDHILFVAALCLPYLPVDWRKILVLVTAFTLGHSLTLALSTYKKILIPGPWIEFLIPVTIMIMAIENLGVKRSGKSSPWRYLSALLFGLIHGMGFSNFLRSMMGKSANIVVELLAFNIGLEVGQIIIVFAILSLSYIFVQRFKISPGSWLLFTSGAIFSLATLMAVQRFPVSI